MSGNSDWLITNRSVRHPAKLAMNLHKLELVHRTIIIKDLDIMTVRFFLIGI